MHADMHDIVAVGNSDIAAAPQLRKINDITS